MFETIASLGVLGYAVFAALAVVVGFGLVAFVARSRVRRAEIRQERIARWQANPREMARAIAAHFAEGRAAITGRLIVATTKRDEADAGLRRYEESLPQRPAWKWAMLVALIPLTAILLYTQIVSDIASFAAQGRAPQVAVVLGLALAVSIFAVPLFIRIHTDGMQAGVHRVGWFAALAFSVVFLIGVAVLVAGGRGEAQFATSIQTSISNLAWYEAEGDSAAAAAAEEEHLADLRAQRDAVIEQDRVFAGGLSAAEAVFGWLEADSLAGAWLLMQRANRRRHRLSIVRKEATRDRYDRRIQRAIIRGAIEAGVLGQLQDDRPLLLVQGQVDPGSTDGADVPGLTRADPAVAGPDDSGDDLVGAGAGPVPSTTTFDDNL